MENWDYILKLRFEIKANSWYWIEIEKNIEHWILKLKFKTEIGNCTRNWKLDLKLKIKI